MAMPISSSTVVRESSTQRRAWRTHWISCRVTSGSRCGPTNTRKTTSRTTISHPPRPKNPVPPIVHLYVSKSAEAVPLLHRGAGPGVQGRELS